MSPEHAFQLRLRVSLVQSEGSVQEVGLPPDGGRAGWRPAQVGQVVEMKDPGDRVLVKRALGLSMHKCRGGGALESGGAQILPHVGLGSLARAGGVNAHSSEQASRANPALAEACGYRHLSGTLPA